MKKLMILGAGVYQVPAIKKAKDMGLQAVVLSSEIKKYPGYKFADIAYEVDTKDQKKVLSLAKKLKVNGVFTAGTDVALKAIGYVNGKLKLVGPSYEACQLSTDKRLMKRRFLEAGVPTAEFFEVKNHKELVDAALRIGFPVMVKAINSSGSRGVSKAASLSRLNEAWAFSKKYSNKGEPVIVEKYLTGIEFGAQVFTYKNRVKIVCPHNDLVTDPPHSTPIGHSYPFSYPEFNTEIAKITKKAIKALGIDNSAANIDMILTAEGVKVLEVGARMGATCLPELTEIYSGIDVVKECIKMSLGGKPDFTITNHQPAAGLLIGSEEDGRIQEIGLSKTFARDIYLKEIAFDVKKGDKVKKFVIGPDRIGQIIVTGPSAFEAEAIAQKVRSKVKIKLS